MQRVFAIVVCVMLCSGVASAGENEAPAQELASEEQKTLYAAGMSLAQRVWPVQLDDDELAALAAGFADAIRERESRVDLADYGPRVQALFQARMEEVSRAERTRGDAFREKFAGGASVARTESGLLFQSMRVGDGAAPSGSDTVTLHYHGTLPDGSVFDSSVEAPDAKPVSFRLDSVVPCFVEGITRMRVGGKARLVCPPEIAYGDRGAPPFIRPGATLIFDVELFGIADAVAGSPAP